MAWSDAARRAAAETRRRNKKRGYAAHVSAAFKKVGYKGLMFKWSAPTKFDPRRLKIVEQASKSQYAKVLKILHSHGLSTENLGSGRGGGETFVGKMKSKTSW